MIDAMHLRHLSLVIGVACGSVIAAENSPLTTASSEFVRVQAASPIAWQPWNEASLTRARESGRSVYVFVGSPLSELTRATINQTFTSEKTVTWLNENFFCIFVDADERPDVAAYAQHFITRVKQLRGWPAHLWLTPDLKPYDGANYLPPSEEWGKPGYLKAARSALETWTKEPARARALASEALTMMRSTPLGSGSKIELESKLAAATTQWLATVDVEHGGFGSAPKQPEPELIRFLLTRGPVARAAALKAARTLMESPVRDPVDGGFYRRAIDEAWNEPYRQKILVEQARIALALLDAAEVGNDDKFRAAAAGALDFVLKNLRNPDGTFAAALDGTLEEITNPVTRPNFRRVGRAANGALGLFIAALQRTSEPRFTAVAAQLGDGLLEHLKKSDFALENITGMKTPATAGDYIAVALAFRALRNPAAAERLLARANEQYFDRATGTYLAAPATLPIGIAVRAPASSDPLSPEALAVLARANESTTAVLRRSLLSAIEYEELPPGDVLLALSLNL